MPLNKETKPLTVTLSIFISSLFRFVYFSYFIIGWRFPRRWCQCASISFRISLFFILTRITWQFPFLIVEKIFRFHRWLFPVSRVIVSGFTDPLVCESYDVPCPAEFLFSVLRDHVLHFTPLLNYVASDILTCTDLSIAVYTVTSYCSSFVIAHLSLTYNMAGKIVLLKILGLCIQQS